MFKLIDKMTKLYVKNLLFNYLSCCFMFLAQYRFSSSIKRFQSGIKSIDFGIKNQKCWYRDNTRVNACELYADSSLFKCILITLSLAVGMIFNEWLMKENCALLGVWSAVVLAVGFILSCPSHLLYYRSQFLDCVHVYLFYYS